MNVKDIWKIKDIFYNKDKNLIKIVKIVRKIVKMLKSKDIWKIKDIFYNKNCKDVKNRKIFYNKDNKM